MKAFLIILLSIASLTAMAEDVLPVKKPATDGKVWGALIYASGGEENDTPDDVPDEVEDLYERLAKVFPYKHFEILGKHTQDIFRQYESWVVPSRDLFLKLDSKGPAEGGGINLNLQFWNKETVIVKTDTVLRLDSPLFIGGPKWKDGKLLFVLLLTNVDSKK